MIRQLSTFAKVAAVSLIGLVATALPARAQYGLLFSGAGPVNRAMAGASVATAADASGGLFWNPATISGLDRSEMDFGLEILDPRTRVASTIPAGALGALGPAVTLSGSNDGDNGVFPLPTVGLVYRPEGCDWTFGLSIVEVGGFGVNYPASATNPVLSAPSPVGMGLGDVYSQLQVFEIAPSISYQLTDRLAVAFGPNIDLAELKVAPAFITSPVANPDGLMPSYPDGTHGRYEWGFGIQAGLTYALTDDWKIGTSVKSPRWFERFGFVSEDGLGRSHNFTFDADLPLVASAGVSYTGFQRWLLEADFHYIDYANTSGFRDSGFSDTGALTGLGWKSIYAIALGAQYRVTDNFSVQMGYSYNDNPIDSSNAFFNIASPTIIENTVSLGFSYKLSDTFSLSVAYGHGFEQSVNGSIVLPGVGTVPGSKFSSTVSADSVVLGGTVLFGGARKTCCDPPAAQE
jgi:long-chain fatty acid transport protein